jgi:hypothetical protein
MKKLLLLAFCFFPLTSFGWWVPEPEIITFQESTTQANLGVRKDFPVCYSASFTDCIVKDGGENFRSPNILSGKTINTVVGSLSLIAELCPSADGLVWDSEKNLCVIKPTWKPSETWSACSATCGGGTETQEFVCKNADGTPSSLCIAEEKPANLTQACNTQACATWQLSETWSGCNNTYGCGKGTQTQSYVCKNASNTIVADSNCTGAKPVAKTQACDQPCYKWDSFSAWGDCINGIQTKPVVCAKTPWKDYGKAIVDNSFCGGTPPVFSQKCSMPVAPAAPTPPAPTSCPYGEVFNSLYQTCICGWGRERHIGGTCLCAGGSYDNGRGGCDHY